MLLPVGLAVIALFAVSRLILKRDSGSEGNHKTQRHEDYHHDVFGYVSNESPPKEEVEEVKRINSISRPGSSVSLVSLTSQDAEQMLLPEFKDLIHVDFVPDAIYEKGTRRGIGGSNKRYGEDATGFSDGILEIPEEILLLHNRAAESGAEAPEFIPDQLDYDFREYVDTLANDAEELGQLRIAVNNLKEREVQLEGQLLEFHGMKEREKVISVMEEELVRRASEVAKLNSEIAKLNSKIGSLEAREMKTSAEISKERNDASVKRRDMEDLRKEFNEARLKIREMETVRKDLSDTRSKNRDLEKQMQLSGQAKAELLIMKQQLRSLQAKEEEFGKAEQKLQSLTQLEGDVRELRRVNKELSYEKRELVVKLSAAESQISSFSKISEHDLVLRAQEDAAKLRHANEDLFKQVEGLQTSRFSEVEELVYLRWVNACLRYELRNFKAPSGKATALDLNKNLSPKSQNLAKQLMVEYAGSDVQSLRAKDQLDSGYESASSEPSTTSEQTDLHDEPSETSSIRSGGKRSAIIKKLKRWGSRQSDGQELSAHSSGRSSPAHHRQPSGGSSRASGEFVIRPSSDSHEIVTYGSRDALLSPDGHTRSDTSETNSDGKRPELLARKANLKPIRTRDKPDGFNGVAASFQLMSKSVSAADEKYPAFKERHKLATEREKAIKAKTEQVAASKRTEVVKMTAAEVEKRALRVAKPPPKPSAVKPPSPVSPGKVVGSTPQTPPRPPPPPRAPGGPGGPIPPPPPPPPPGTSKLPGGGNKMQRAPEVVEFYQSLMKRDAKKEIAAAGSGQSADARNNMIGEIENRSTHLLAIKADVETQGDFVQSLAAEVREAKYTNIEDVVAFVSWLDDELSFLVDERAVLKHFDWPEGKADALREASFEYQDLNKLNKELSTYVDDQQQSCEAAIKKMLSTLEKVEQSVFVLLRTRDMVIGRYKEFNIPTNWMLDTGVVGKIKAATVKLAKLYMKRIASELDRLGPGSEKEPAREFLLLQGVRFAFRVHQFAGGFDPESMKAFEELRNRAHQRAAVEQPPG